jgi:Lon protease-like protein
MTERIPLFPLGTVLYPGLLLPLHIFEDRYRQLVRELLDGPGPKEFGVIAIRKGRETGIDGISGLYEVGCTAALRQVEQHEDGGFDLVTVGAQRFRLMALDDSLPYLQGEVEMLPEETGDVAAAEVAVGSVHGAFRSYLDALNLQGITQAAIGELPADPLLLSYLVAASLVVEVPDRQALLAEPDARSRLEAERAVLARETSMLRSLTSRPATDLRNSPYNPN